MAEEIFVAADGRTSSKWSGTIHPSEIVVDFDGNNVTRMVMHGGNGKVVILPEPGFPSINIIREP